MLWPKSRLLDVNVRAQAAGAGREMQRSHVAITAPSSSHPVTRLEFKCLFPKVQSSMEAS
jgi:hypothetical protein